jgi:hypothetical protein
MNEPCNQIVYSQGYQRGREDAATKGVVNNDFSGRPDDAGAWLAGYDRGFADYFRYEADRLEELKETQETFAGSDLQKRFGPGSFGHHEVVDRAYVASEVWDMVASSPATLLDPELNADARRIGDLIFDFYQKAAMIDYSAEQKDFPEEGHVLPPIERV